MKKYLLAISFLLTSSVFHLAQSQSQFTGWLASFNTFKTGKKTSIHADVQLRSTDEIKQVQTLLIRSGLNIHLTKKLTVTAGYAFVNNKRVIGTASGFTIEHRAWEQVLYNHKLKSVFVSHRLRLEQRFIPKIIVVHNELEKDGTLYSNRLRYFIRNVLPFKKEAAFKKGMFAALQNEVFVNIGNTSNVNGKFFDQNRLYLATGYRLSSKADLEIGYLNQYVNGRGNQFTNNHVIQLASYLRL